MNSKQDSYCTGFLFSDPSFFKGAGTIFNVWGNYYTFNYSHTNEEADERAIASDWRIVGKDLRGAMGKVEDEIESVEKAA